MISSDLEKLNLETLLAHAAPENSAPNSQTPKTRELNKFVGFAARYAAEWGGNLTETNQKRLEKLKQCEDSGMMVALIGERGTGKTRLCAEIARFLTHDRPKKKIVRYRHAAALFLEIRESYRPNAPQSERELIRKFSEVDLLILDEMQDRRETVAENTTLNLIIDNRYSRKLPTFFIANLTKAECIANLGASIADRIAEGGGFMNFPESSMRGNIAQ